MELMTGLGGSLLGTIIPFLAVLTLVVFIHELGHFLVARWCGVAVKTFSVGFGPEIWGFEDRRGTRWRLAVIPLGGYVKFIDDANAASMPASNAPAEPGAFRSASVARRSAIVAAGPIANFLLALVIYTALFASLGRPVTLPEVTEVLPDSAAAEAGFQPGDIVLAIDGDPVESFSDIQRVVFISVGETLTFTVRRGGVSIDLAATPRLGEATDAFGNVQRVGLLGIRHEAVEVKIQEFGPVAAFGEAMSEVWHVISGTVGYLSKVIVGSQSPDQLGGPIGIAKVSGQAAEMGLIPLINLAAVLSVSIGLLNLFPIPLLDGGHLLYYAIEALRGRPLSDRVQDLGFWVGFAIVLMLMVLGTFNDIVRLANG